MSRYRQHSDGRVRMSRRVEQALNWAAALALAVGLGYLAAIRF